MIAYLKGQRMRKLMKISIIMTCKQMKLKLLKLIRMKKIMVGVMVEIGEVILTKRTDTKINLIWR